MPTPIAERLIDDHSLFKLDDSIEIKLPDTLGDLGLPDEEISSTENIEVRPGRIVTDITLETIIPEEPKALTTVEAIRISIRRIRERL